MAQESESPFKPGTRVAISDGWGFWKEGRVGKVYKTGRFVLEGDSSNQQWRPWGAASGEGAVSWHASMSGEHASWKRDCVYDWASNEKSILYGMQTAERKRRFKALRDYIDRQQPDALSVETIDAIEKLLTDATPSKRGA